MNPILKKCLVVLAVFVVGFAIGRFLVPGKVEVKEKQVQVEKLVEVESKEAQEKIRLLEAQLEEFKQTVHREVVVVVRPDGTTESKTTEDINTEKTKTSTKDESHEKIEKVEVVRYVDRIVEVEKSHTVTSDKPMNHVSLLAGGVFTVDQFSVVPSFGVQYQRRLAGPFFAGVLGVYTPAQAEVAGLISLGIEF